MAKDKKNKLNTDELVSDYFAVMGITDEDKQDREELAIDLYMIFSEVFDMARVMIAVNKIDEDYIKATIDNKLKSVVSEHYGNNILNESSIAEYCNAQAVQIADTTINRIDDEFYLSDDRALLISENLANGFGNYQYEQEAIKNGYTHKTWNTILDGKERHTHRDLSGVTIPIQSKFSVGASQMYFPCDISLGAEIKETANCRCFLTYNFRSKKTDNDIESQDSPNINQRSGNKVDITDIAINKVSELTSKLLSDEQNKVLYKKKQEVLNIAKDKNNSNEVTTGYSLNNDKSVTVLGFENYTPLSKDVNFRSLLIGAKPLELMIVHNHPSCTSFSAEDIVLFLYPQVKGIVITTNMGKTISMIKKDTFDSLRAEDILYNKSRDMNFDDVLKEITHCGAEYNR